MKAVSLHNDWLTVRVVPEAGGRIVELSERSSGHNLLWQNPRVPLRPTYPGAAFDDVWTGGWDEVFPTDEACRIGDNALPDHGDLWTGPWEWQRVERDGDPAVQLTRLSPALPCRLDKWLTVRRTEPVCEVQLELHNLGPHPVAFLWNQHVAHAIGPGSTVHLPAGRMAVAGAGGSRAGHRRTVSWPDDPIGGDLSRLPGPDAGVTELLHALDLRAGWCAVTHPAYGLAVRICFDIQLFRTVWLWGVFGGWRGHHLLLTEPCTGAPGGLAAAVQRGDAAHLAPGATLRTALTVTVATAFDPTTPGDQDPLR